MSPYSEPPTRRVVPLAGSVPVATTQGTLALDALAYLDACH